MFQELKFQLSSAILTVVTIAAVVAGVLNYGQNRRFPLPDDGVTWIDAESSSGNVVSAYQVSPASAAYRVAGLHKGDEVLAINGVKLRNSLDVARILAGVGAWGSATYTIRRDGVEFPAKVYIGQAPRSQALFFQYPVGLAYLVIGLFVYFRRNSAYKARHFFVFCLTSYIFCCFHYTGKLNTFDKVIFWCNDIAGWLAPTLFLHFCLTFPEPRKWWRERIHAPLLYLPGLAYTVISVAVATGSLRFTSMPLIEVRWMLDRTWMGLLTALYLTGGVVLAIETRRSEDPIIRQQLKWLRNGTLFGFVPFAIFYSIPYITAGMGLKYAVLSLPLIPLTLAYAIARYRLMDVDIIFRRGYAYTLATLCVLAGFYAVVFSLARLVQKNFQQLGNSELMVVMLIAAFLFQPIRNWIQERLDRFFYRDRYDYRRTMIEFARELNSEMNLDRMLSSVGDRLMQTLSIRHVSFFLEGDRAAEIEATFRLAKSMGSNGRGPVDMDRLDLSFLGWKRNTPYIFFERTRYHLDAVAESWPASVRQTVADLDLSYYIPCLVLGRVIAFIGVSRTEDGEFLSTEDVELLLTLAGYVGIAIENANLYRSLEMKVAEYERLKEFSENIVESINVGVLAAGLDDRVESWNSQMESLTGITRDQAVGQPLEDVLPGELCAQLLNVRGETGVHHIYKFSLRRPASASASVTVANGGANGNGSGNGNGGSHAREAIVNIAVAPLISRDQEHIGRLVIFDDITERSELERRLVQADKLSSIGLLVAGVAHEVNTPLAVISTYAQMLAKQVQGDEQKSRMLEKIAGQTFRASEIVNSLLNFSRTSTTEVAEVNLNRVIQETLSIIEHQLKKSSIEVKTRLNASAGIKGSPGKLQQVFLNLFLNARDAMETGGTLEVETTSDDAGVHIDVSDTGHGIAPENLHRIFDPFFTTKGTKKGTGLGLSVSYGIMQEHNGVIEVFQRPGGGTRFHLEFPAVRKPVNA
jgi:two-component system NtrC family sensor kinase